MKKSLYIIFLIICFILGILSGLILSINVEKMQLGKYDLYNCIYNNAQDNGFNQNPLMIKKIQDECVCFRENNYTNLLGANC